MNAESRPIGVNGQPLWLPKNPLCREELIAIGATEFEAKLLENEVIENDFSDEEVNRQFADFFIIQRELEVIQTIETKIIHGKASNGEIYQWHKTQDPLRMGHVFDDFVATKDEDSSFKIREKQLRKAIILENGAETIVLNTLTPDWQSYKQYEDSNAIEMANAPMDLLNLSAEAIDVNKDKKYPIKELKDLIVASDMLGEFVDVARDNSLINFPEDYLELMSQYKLTLLDFVVASGTCSDEVDWLIRGDVFMRYASSIFFGLKNVSATEEQFDKARGHLLSQIISEVDKNADKIETKSNRGFLHEYMWVLDSMMFAYVNRKENFYVLPSMVYEDEPTIGKPHYNRAFDLRLGIVGGKVDLIQLKSSTRDWGKNYHPLVREIKEETFKDAQPSRLKAKLRTYKKIVNGEVIDKKEAFEEYALPSVLKTLDDFFVS